MSQVSAWGRALTEAYPDPTLWPKYDPSWKDDVFRFARLWITEGIPFAFRARPMAFEFAREKLAKRLLIDPKAVNLTGSASSGYSFTPAKFGRKYQPKDSDVDLLIVSEVFFSKIADDFNLFAARYAANLEVPSTDAERRFWPINIAETPGTMRRGFIDQWRIPLRSSYVNVRELRSAAEMFKNNINKELDPPDTISKVSIRVYKNWDCAVRQIGGSFLKALI